MFTHLSISKKLGVSILTSLLLLSAVIVFLLTGLDGMNQDLNRLIKGPMEQKSQTYYSRILSLQLARDIRDMYISETGSFFGEAPSGEKLAGYKSAIAKDIEALKEQMEVLSHSYAAEDAEFAGYRTAVEEWTAIGERIVAAVTAGNTKEAAGLLLKDCPEALDKVSEIAAKLQQESSAAVEKTAEHSLKQVRTTLLISLIAFLTTGFLSAILYWKIRKGILAPVRELGIYAEAVSKGRLNEAIGYRSQDEFGKLADSMRASSRTLNGYIADIRRAMKELSEGNFRIQASQPFDGDFAEIEASIDSFVSAISETLAKVNDFTSQVALGADEVAIGAQNLAQGSTEQAASVQEMTAGIADTSDKVMENAKKAEQAREAARTASRDIEECTKKMAQMKTAMDATEQEVQKIRSIVGEIQEISSQTNLLALNAAVEAAHAGQAGKGFAVVAGQVKELAAKSSAASGNTTEYIARITAAVKKGADIAEDTSKALQITVEKVEQTAGMLEEMTKVSTRQAELLSQVTEGMNQISIVVQNNSATSQEEAAASLQLSHLAQTLHGLVGRFKLHEKK